MSRIQHRARALFLLLSHIVLGIFSLLVVLKLEHGKKYFSWWYVFSPLWVFHLLTARSRCSIPAPNTAKDKQWRPLHSLLSIPLLVCFEVLLCCYLSSLDENQEPPMPLELVFLPLVFLEAVILADNFRMCVLLMPGDDETITDEALWETMPHFILVVSMVFILAATVFAVLKLSGRMDVLDWWDLLVNLCIGEFFGSLLCVTWMNPFHPPIPVDVAVPLSRAPAPAPEPEPAAAVVDSHPTDNSRDTASSSGSSSIASSSVVPLLEHSASSTRRQLPVSENQGQVPGLADSEADEMELPCGVSEMGGHFLRLAVLAFQVAICMRLEGEPQWVRKTSWWLLFSPVLLVHVAAVLSAALQWVHTMLLGRGGEQSQAGRVAAMAYSNDPFSFLTRGMRLLGWWSAEDEFQAQLQHAMCYDSLFCEPHSFLPTPTPAIKKMRKGELQDEVVKLQAALVEQGEMTKAQRRQLEQIQQEKILCRICFEREIALVLMPCKHRVLCEVCADKCKQCPICRRRVVQRLVVYDS